LSLGWAAVGSRRLLDGMSHPCLAGRNSDASLTMKVLGLLSGYFVN